MRTNRTEPNNLDPDRGLDQATGIADDGDYRGTEARQGRSGKPVLAVLLGALALAFLVWAGVEFYGNTLPGNTPGNEATVAEPSTESGDGLENNVPTTENPNAAQTRQAVPSLDGSPAAKGTGEGPPTSTNDGQVPGTGATTTDPGAATTGGTTPNSPTP